MEVHQQNALFQYFADTLTAVVQNAKKNGRYDMGILGEWGHFRVLCAPCPEYLPTYTPCFFLKIWVLEMRR